MSNFKRAIKRAVKYLANPVEYFTPQHGLEIEPYIEKENLQGIHHLGRYYWARQVLQTIQPRNLLDIVCGPGYGSYLLASQLPQTRVTGADYDSRAVAASKKNYTCKNLNYLYGNMTTWESDDQGIVRPLGIYDAIVSFDTIEHLEHREIALMRITENLSERGVLLLSTPCGHEVSQLHPDQPHHKIEYSYRDLQNLLKRFFKTVLLPEDGTLPHLEFWSEVVNKGKKRYKNLSNPVYCADPIK